MASHGSPPGVCSGESTATLAEHGYAVWSCDFHYTGNFLATASMDNTVKIWDLNAVRCRQTLRGHKDSVNYTSFQFQSNILASASADHTVCLWDARSGLQTNVLKEHSNACNSAAFSRDGHLLASCDADGVAVVWEVRTLAPLMRVDLGPHPANHVSFDPSGGFLAVSSGDSRVSVLDTLTGELLNEVSRAAPRFGLLLPGDRPAAPRTPRCCAASCGPSRRVAPVDVATMREGRRPGLTRGSSHCHATPCAAHRPQRCGANGCLRPHGRVAVLRWRRRHHPTVVHLTLTEVRLTPMPPSPGGM